ncbi:hypothetical protein GDO78_015935 [Eleutherodactylus coqui]|uniref:TNFR-Cys domain-containing protein n=1 Tax=Eleutherodactylus coqui TaxID=57060 RepID=A0A8J6ELC6_ELECQ|nr:hypothetical protein GDO78_015935 [Eleutherodactylus coqui]
MGLRLDPRLVLLLLGIVLVNVAQIVAHEQVSCNETQYLQEDLNRCCNRCPPGHFREKKCTQSSETECKACGAGTYAAQWNYAEKCRRCSPCRKDLVERQPCNATQAAVCDCPDGYTCAQLDALKKCEFCKALPSTEAPEEPLPDMKSAWIIVGVVLFIATSFVVIVCLKARLLKKFGACSILYHLWSLAYGDTFSALLYAPLLYGKCILEFCTVSRLLV